ncbi:MAG: protein-L-isoaspartate O-methyltransferase [Kangiellaceae bacterium]|nr:protein-L-isoaspartate O-methyltransferase [Kangiellaceae bacterium]
MGEYSTQQVNHDSSSETNAKFSTELARHNMVEQQIRPWNVLDNRVLDLMASVPRDKFIDEPYQALAYSDMPIPLGHSQFTMPPREEARMLQALNIQSSDIVLEIGTGCGYCSALLANQAHKVYSVEIIEEFLQKAEAITQQLGLENIIFEEGDASTGWPHYKPYDVIAIMGGFFQVPESYKRSLQIGGRLFCIEGQEHLMQAKLITRLSEDEWHEQNLYETQIGLLINAKRAQQFIF